MNAPLPARKSRRVLAWLVFDQVGKRLMDMPLRELQGLVSDMMRANDLPPVGWLTVDAFRKEYLRGLMP